VESEIIANVATQPRQEQQAGPAAEYSRRLKFYEKESKRRQRQHIWAGNAKVVFFLAILVLCWTIGKSGKPSWVWLVGAVGFFIVLVLSHRRILRAKNRAERAAGYYSRGIARIEDRWSGSGDTGVEFSALDHLYADDLDIFGQGSLFQLLCTARSRMGKKKLADWLMTQADHDEIHDRQTAVSALRDNTGLRESLALAGDQELIAADPEKLQRWSELRVELDFRRWWPAVILLNLATLATLGYAIAGEILHGDGLWTPFIVMLVVNRAVLYYLKGRLRLLFSELDHACRNLTALASLLLEVETEQFSCPRLQRLRQTLISQRIKASEAIARLGSLCDYEQSRHNQMVIALELTLLYSVHIALGLQRWRERHAGNVTDWLNAVAEFEALAALGTYAFEHPQDPFPEIAGTASQPSVEAQGLGHPLLPAAQCVRNDVRLGGERQVLLVSGSNMSGKSTLLRAVGINAVLAMMGAPVRARTFRISALALGASMRISDSLQKGVSHFYAEISRIRQVVELSSKGPLLFLFDEILQGTNSHDRRIGAEGILRTLLRNGAIGLVTTHDLALTSLEEMFPKRIANVHFQEKLESGKLSFDYHLREGVVTTSNGLELMKSIGLEVE
jgi:MutS-like protein